MATPPVTAIGRMNSSRLLGKPTAPGNQAWKAIHRYPRASANTEGPPGPLKVGWDAKRGWADDSPHGPSGPAQRATPMA